MPDEATATLDRPTIPDDLPRHWRYALSESARRGWELFPIGNQYDGSPLPEKAIDWSKQPRGRCNECRKRTTPVADGGQGVTRKDCYALCQHALCHGLHGATADLDTLVGWARGRDMRGRPMWTANIAMRTGPGSGVFVVDVDGDDGLARLAALEAEHGPLPETRMHRTGGGTFHHLFLYPAERNPSRADGLWGNSAGTKLGTGLDTRGAGGYIVLPGAVSAKGRYTPHNQLPMADVPQWLLDLLSATRPRSTMTPERRRQLAATPRFDLSRAPGAVHPYAAAVLTRRVEEFRALVGEGNGRTDLLTGGAKYLSGLANATPPSGLTEAVVRDAFAEACQANGYADAHQDWEYQLDRGIEDGRREIPRNWPPRETMPEADQAMLDALVRQDPQEMAALTSAFGPGWASAFRGAWRGHPALAAAGLAEPSHPVEPPPTPDEGTAVVDDPTDAAEPVAAPDPADAGAPPNEPGAATVEAEPEDRRVTVVVSGRDFAELRDEIHKIITLTNARDPWLFLHGRSPALAARHELQPCTAPLLASRLADRCRFIAVKHSDGVPTARPADPPMNHIGALLADAANLGLPEVDRVAHAPFFGPDGTLQRQPGYHAKARILFVPTPGLIVPEIPVAPTAEQVAAALTLINDELLGDFPFATRADRVGALALGLTPAVRPMIDGPTPLFGIDAPDSRTGKGLLMEVLLRPWWGRGYTVTAAPERIEEWAKSIVACLRSGPVAAIFDNANARIDSGALASAVTAYPLYTSRILGLSENVHMALPAVWVATGNNLVASRENANRTVRVRIDAKRERPGERTGWRHPNLRRWQNEHTGEIVAAWLTLVQAWLAAGRPVHPGLATMGGFESWVEVVGSILSFHGFTELLGNREQLVDTLFDDGADWGGMVAMMRAELEAPSGGRTEWTATELVECMVRLGIDPPVDLPPSGPAYAGRTLARAMRPVRDRRFGDHVLRMAVRHNVTRWLLESV